MRMPGQTWPGAAASGFGGPAHFAFENDLRRNLSSRASSMSRPSMQMSRLPDPNATSPSATVARMERRVIRELLDELA
jgi:hypothetical protein